MTTTHKRAALSAAALAAVFAAGAHATTVRIEVRGTVDYNLIGGAMAGTPSGTAVVMGFEVDSADYLDSPNFPTRGYRIDLASFDLAVGGVHVRLDDPQPDADAYFVLRDNDPAVDGFFISQGNVEWPMPVSLHIPGVGPAHELEFSRGFDDGTPLSSLDILDAVGTYGFENMSSFQWTIGQGGGIGAEYIYESISITAVPEPATLSLLGLGVLAVAARTRRARTL